MNPIRFIQLLFVKDRKFAMSLYPVIGYIPHNIDFYKIPFIHKASSVIMHDGYMINNERLEYLGDAVLDAVIAEYLFDRYPDKNEGFLSQMRSKLVKRQNLNSLGLKLGLDPIADPFITNNNLGKNFYGDVLEAMIGDIYHDKGYKCARRFVIGTLSEKHINMS